MHDNTPILIGVGEASERLDSPDYAALSPVELAARAAAAALEDAGPAAALAPRIDVIAAIRQFEVSGPRAVPPFGASKNFPRSIAARIGADPVRAILEPVGGQGPQHLVNEFAQAIGRGDVGLVLLCGSEAISTVRDLAGRGERRDWAEDPGGELEDRGFGDIRFSRVLARHGARRPIHLFAVSVIARRARLGLDRRAYALEMGRLFAPFTEVAAGNPHAMSPEAATPEDLVTPSPRNRIVSDPFTRRVVARDQANQGAAVLMSSVGRARELGVPEDRWIFLHGGADAVERAPLERQDLAAYPAAGLALREALKRAGLGPADVGVFDLYSCFPIAVFSTREELGMDADDPRPLTVTGGLPFFGGAGNNYSMHAIASMVRALRKAPGAFGLVGANGGYLSKYSVGVYSARPTAWRPFDSADLQAQIDAWPAVAEADAGALALEGTIETYTIDEDRKPPTAIVVARTADGKRFTAATDAPDLVETLRAAEPLGGSIRTEPGADETRRIAGFTAA
jgi:acetyl-CoA C-acetyltransferase